jgi:hypothetical protein
MMAASSKRMVTDAERRFPCRIKLGIPTGGFGRQLTDMNDRSRSPGHHGGQDARSK